MNKLHKLIYIIVPYFWRNWHGHTQINLSNVKKKIFLIKTVTKIYKHIHQVCNLIFEDTPTHIELISVKIHVTDKQWYNF